MTTKREKLVDIYCKPLYSIYMENNNETRPPHRPNASEASCVCGAQEVFFEGYTLDPGDLGPVVGYGCDAEGHPYVRMLDRLGWHISRDAKRTIQLHLTDEQFNELTDEEFNKVISFEHGG